MRPPLAVLAALATAAIGMAGCSSTQDILEPSAIAASPPAQAALAAQGDAEQAEAVPAVTAALVSSGTRLHFDPIVGASVAAAAPLTERLAARAQARQIAVAGPADPNITHVLKGYFSTIAEGRNTRVIYVWDVYDPAGNRLHRINGRQKASGGAGDWRAVTPATMQAIADDSIDQLAAWLAGRPG